jgi:hypothetical protein
MVALIMVAAGTACSGSKASAPGQSAPADSGRTKAAVQSVSTAIANPCSLASQAEISAVMGRKTKPGEFHKDYGGARCNFYDPTSQYEIFLQTMDPALLDSMTHLPGNTAMSGIGDRALWSDGSLYVQKGSEAMQIGFDLGHPLKTMTPQAEALAKTIVSRM